MTNAPCLISTFFFIFPSSCPLFLIPLCPYRLLQYEQQACAEYLRDEAGVDHSDVWKEAVASLNASNDNPAPAPDAAATAPAAAGFDEAMSSAGAGGGCGGRLSSTELEGLDDLLPSSPARPFKKTGDDARSPFTPGKGGAAASFMSPFGKAAAAHFRSRPSITGRLSILGGRISLAPGAAAGKAGPFGAGASASTGASAPLSSLSESGIGLGDSMMRTPAAGAGGGGDDSDESMALLPPSAGSTRSNAALGGGGGSRLNLAKSVGANGEVPPPPAGDEDGSNISGWFGGAGGVQQRKSAGSSSSSSSSNSNSSSVGSATKAENLRGFFTQPTSSSAAAAAAPSSSSSTVTLQQLQGQVYRRASSTLPPGHIRLFSSNESEENQQYFCWTVAFIVLFLWLTVQRLFGCGAV